MTPHFTEPAPAPLAPAVVPKLDSILERLDNEPRDAGAYPLNPDYLKNMSEDNAIKAVNNTVNGYRFIDDKNGDHWDSPGEFFAQGGGDCEDFAITKYAWLRALGLPEENLRIAVVNDLFVNRAHAILLVDTPQQSYILDSQEPVARNDVLMARYEPIYSFNHAGLWIY